MSSNVRVVTRAPRRRGWRRLLSLRLWLVAALAGIVLAVAGFAAAYALIDVPDPNEAAQTQTSIIYFADGKTEIGRISALNREAVPLSKVPDHVERAMIAAEDRSFYDNPGISLTGIGRAVWSALSGGQRQGGSTITQQYVKNYFLTQDQTLVRKGRELIIALKIERELSKEEILENYLNTIYFGRGAHGIQAASRAYFSKDVSKLTVAEGALLSSVIRGPSLYDPALGAKQKANAASRFNYVLDGMVEQGWLTARDRGRTRFPQVKPEKRRTVASGTNGYLLNLVKNELVARVGLTPEQVDTGGLRITTTISKRDQEAAIEAVRNERPVGGRGEQIRVGLVSMKPGDGAIIALYGGEDAAKQQYSAATQAQLQGGSTFKVFTLVAALQQGISTKSTFDGSSPRYFDAFKGGPNASGKVQNFGNHSYGRLDLRSATAKSSNTIYAELNTQVTPKATVDAALALGLPRDTLGLFENAANVFGTASPRVIDMATAYATLAAKGVRAEPYLIREVRGVDKRFDAYVASPTTSRAVSEEVAADAVDAMEQVVKRGTATHASRLGRPAAGKTGTTDENRAVWFDGFTPEVATAVAMYWPDEQGNAQPMRGIGGFGELTGGSYPVDIWTAFMRDVVRDTPETDFPDRAGIGDENAKGGPESGDGDQRPVPEAPPAEPTAEPTEATPTTAATGDPTGEPTWEPTDVPTDRPSPPAQPGDRSADPARETRRPTSGPARSPDGGNPDGQGGDAGRDGPDAEPARPGPPAPPGAAERGAGAAESAP